MSIHPEQAANQQLAAIDEASHLNEIATTGKNYLARVALIIGIVAAASTDVLVAPPAAHAATTFANDYPDLDATDCSATYGIYSWCKDGAHGSSRGYDYRNCTDGAAYWTMKYTNVNVAGWGNANTWNTKAGADKYSVYNGNTNSVEPGDIAQDDTGDFGHVGFVTDVSKNNDGSMASITVAELNKDAMGDYSHTTYTSKDAGGNFIRNAAGKTWDHIIDVNGAGKGLGNESIQTSGAPAPNPNTALQMLLTPGQAVYGKVVNGKDGWNRESFDGTVTKIAAGGYVQMALANNGEVWARNTDTAGTNWTKESDAGTGADIAVSSTGVQMVRATDNEVWAKNSIGYKGWTGEAGAGTAAAIAVGGDTQMLITGDGTVYAKNGIGVDGWHKETDAHVGAKIAASSTGVQMVGVTNGEVWAKQNDVNYGGWTPEASAGTAASIATGGDNQMLITGDGTVYAKNTIGVNGWNRETDAGVGTAASVSTAGLQMLETTDGQVWSMTSISYNNWTGEADPGTAVAVATGG